MNSTIKDIFEKHGDSYINHFRNNIPKSHIKVIHAIKNCKTDLYGSVFYKCQGCGKIHGSYRSCGNRHCPNCQNNKTKKWVNKQIQKEIKCNHFMLTFTVPSELRNAIRKNKKICYSALFYSSSASIKKLIQDKRFLRGGTPGYWGVLHTWGRQLQYHPHIHYVVTGGTINKDCKSWNRSKKGFFLPVKVLSKIYKGKFKSAMKRAGIFDSIPPEVWNIDWNVNCKPVGNGKTCTKYLSRYVFKVAISNSRILKVTTNSVHISYRKKGTTEKSILKLKVFEFIRRFLQHILPNGFMKIRYYGFLHPSFSIPFNELKRIIEGYSRTKKIHLPKVKHITVKCKSCGDNMKFLYSILPGNIRIISHGFP